MRQCDYVSERSGTRCQLVGVSAHRVWGFHMAWSLSGIPMLKTPWCPEDES